MNFVTVPNDWYRPDRALLTDEHGRGWWNNRNGPTWLEIGHGAEGALHCENEHGSHDRQAAIRTRTLKALGQLPTERGTYCACDTWWCM